MTTELRLLLDSCATQQDYLWFLAILAWSGVIAAGLKRAVRTQTTDSRWLVALAASYAAGALIELLLLAQDLKTPYTRSDFAMGLAQALGAAALVWGAVRHLRRADLFAFAALIVSAGLATARHWLPIEAGFALAAIQAVAVLSLWRQQPRPLPAVGLWLLVLSPLLTTHGPIAHAFGHARLTTDWSRFSLPAAASSFACGALLAATMWRSQLREIDSGPQLRRDLRRALAILACWLAAGVALTVWFGRTARQSFEDNLLRRVEIVALALDPAQLADAFGADLKIESLVRSYYPSGEPVDVATAPRTGLPVYEHLRQQLRRIRVANDDFHYLYLATWRQRQLLVLDPEPPKRPAIRHVIDHAMGHEDLERLADRTAYLEGPMRTTWGTFFSAKAPLIDPTSHQILGWLVADVEATRWAASFVAARLQTMALVGIGVGLWISALAYRLRRAERETAQRKALAAAAADRMKSAFLAKVSHELRTPIQSVLGFSELLAGTPLPESSRTWLNSLRSHGTLMLRLVNDLIDLGALQSGLFQVRRTTIDLHSVIDDCCAALQPAARTKGLAFTVKIAPDTPRWVLADGVRIRQVLLNLLNNAVKFTSVGAVRLEVSLLDSGQVGFFVADTGPGIPTNQRDRLFQPFSRLEQNVAEGSGLGLALVHGLCLAMGGRVDLLDSSGAGAIFRISLPLSECDAPTAVGPTSASPGTSDFAGRHLLVAEDNTLVRELLTTFLASHGAEVTVAVDGPAALRHVRTRLPDVLLLDIGLPGLDGIEVASTLRREGFTSLPIVGLSAHASEAVALRAHEAGMDVFLPKPVSLTRLAETLDGIFAKSAKTTSTRFANRVSSPSLRSLLWASFVRETPPLLAQMRTALQNKNWEQLREHAHYLKNSADVIEAELLREPCATLYCTQVLDAARATELFGQIESAALLLLASPAKDVPPDRN